MLPAFTYTLDVVYKSGVDYHVCNRKRALGIDISDCYSPFKTSIYLSWNFAGKYYKENVKYKILPCLWNFSEKLPSKKYSNYHELSVMLKSILSRVEKEFLNMRINEKALTPDSIREMVRGIINGPIENIAEKKGLFWRVFDEFLAEKAQLSKPATVVKYKSMHKTLLDFEKTMNYKLSFATINARWYTQFMIYSTSQLVAHKNNTISKNIRMVKSFMNHAYDMKYHKSLEFKRFRAEGETTDPIFLTPEELALIEKCDVGTNKSLVLSKDIFLTGCYTGARISDLMQMKKRQLKVFKDGSIEWENFQIKGRKVKAVKIFIVEPARRVLEKYLIGKGDDDYVFPRIDSAVVNLKLKTLGELAGITSPITKVNYSGKNRIEKTLPKYKYLTTHIGRKTFISILCADNMPDHEIMSLSGHSSSKEIKVYKGVNRTLVLERMKRVFEQDKNNELLEISNVKL